MPTQEREGLITMGDLAKALKIDRYRGYHLVAAGQIPAYRLGRSLRFSLREVLDAMKGQQQARTNGHGAEGST